MDIPSAEKAPGANRPLMRAAAAQLLNDFSEWCENALQAGNRAWVMPLSQKAGGDWSQANRRRKKRASG
jgi:hypothetical protein